MALRDELMALGRAAGLAAVGVCDASPFEDTRRILEARRDEGLSADMAFTYRNPARSTDPGRALEGARSMVVAAYRYDTHVDASPERPSARVARYATGDHYDELRRGLLVISHALRAAGHRSIVVADDNAMVDRAVAVRAGLGWYGKNANVLLPGQGSWFVLGSVITDVELAPTGAPLDEGCGTCTRCLDGCPTAAIVAPGVVDARRCLAWHLQAVGDFPREFREALGDRIYGCDECQEVCPPSRRSDSRHEAARHDAARHDAVRSDGAGTSDEAVGLPGGWVDLEWMLQADDADLLARLGRWYVPRREPRYLRRNALVVFANTADPSDPLVDVLLGRYLDDPDDLLAAHAAWAAVRLGRSDLLATADRRARNAIRDELAAIDRAGRQQPAVAVDVLPTRRGGEDGAP